jgi:hypothetical protein
VERGRDRKNRGMWDSRCENTENKIEKLINK